MGDELRGENLVHLSVRFSTETELKQFQDLLYEKSAGSHPGLVTYNSTCFFSKFFQKCRIFFNFFHHLKMRPL